MKRSGLPPSEHGSWSVAGFDGFNLLRRSYEGITASAALSVAEVRSGVTESLGSKQPESGVDALPTFTDDGDRFERTTVVLQFGRRGWAFV